MVFFKRFEFLLVLLASVAVAHSSPVLANDGQATENPHVVIADVAMEVLKHIEGKRDQYEQQPKLLIELLEAELLPYVDYQYAALKVLGKNYSKVPKAKLPEYIKVFRQYLLNTYATAFFQFEDYQIRFVKQALAAGRKIITVRAVVSFVDKPDVDIALKVRKNSRTGEWKVYDMVAEGISLLSAKQSEVATILRQQGIDGVITSMRDNSQLVLTPPTKTEQAGPGVNKARE